MKTVELKEKDGVYYYSFPLLKQTGMVREGFSTRLGGVSSGIYATMNFTVTRGDDPACVRENYRRMAKALDIPMERMVLSFQAHTTHVMVCDESCAGLGITKERPYRDVDGLITNVPNMPLVTFYADCVPLYFLDPVHRAIGLSHSGWKGTKNRMGKVTVEKMGQVFGSRPEDILAGIGPSICGECFEVGPEVAEEFEQEFSEEVYRRIHWLDPGTGKDHVDLWECNRQILLDAGLKEENIAVAGVCTCCHPDLLFSHRATKGQRGNLAAFLCLNEE